MSSGGISIKPGQTDNTKRTGPDCPQCSDEMWVLETSIPRGMIVFRCSRIGCGNTVERPMREGQK